MKKYKILWNEPTDIAGKLTPEAADALANTDPLEVREYDTPVGYRYALNGCVIMFNLTAEDVIDIAEGWYHDAHNEMD